VKLQDLTIIRASKGKVLISPEGMKGHGVFKVVEVVVGVQEDQFFKTMSCWRIPRRMTSSFEKKKKKLEEWRRGEKMKGPMKANIKKKHGGKMIK
jgi:hypothetical protein